MTLNTSESRNQLGSWLNHNVIKNNYFHSAEGTNAQTTFIEAGL